MAAVEIKIGDLVGSATFNLSAIKNGPPPITTLAGPVSQLPVDSFPVNQSTKCSEINTTTLALAGLNSDNVSSVVVSPPFANATSNGTRAPTPPRSVLPLPTGLALFTGGSQGQFTGVSTAIAASLLQTAIGQFL